MISKNLMNYNLQIKNFKKENQELGLALQDAFSFEINGTKIVQLLKDAFTLFLADFIKEYILSEKGGFPQKDNTYCLFNHTQEILKNICYLQDTNPEFVEEFIQTYAVFFTEKILSFFE